MILRKDLPTAAFVSSYHRSTSSISLAQSTKLLDLYPEWRVTRKKDYIRRRFPISPFRATFEASEDTATFLNSPRESIKLFVTAIVIAEPINMIESNLFQWMSFRLKSGQKAVPADPKRHRIWWKQTVLQQCGHFCASAQKRWTTTACRSDLFTGSCFEFLPLQSTLQPHAIQKRIYSIRCELCQPFKARNIASHCNGLGKLYNKPSYPV